MESIYLVEDLIYQQWQDLLDGPTLYWTILDQMMDREYGFIMMKFKLKVWQQIWGMRSTGDGRVVVGKYDTYTEDWYGTVDVDELLFFNQKLTDHEIRHLQYGCKVKWEVFKYYLFVNLVELINSMSQYRLNPDI